MSWAQRLFGFEGGTDTEVHAALEEVHVHLLGQVRRLRDVAGLAPTAAAETELRSLAQEDEALAAELREQLLAGGSPGPGSGQAEADAPVSGLNHWARLVGVLDQHRATRDLLLSTTARAREIAPDLGVLCERLSHAEETHLTRLRGLVATADPQALD